jgi:hypothetical protein
MGTQFHVIVITPYMSDVLEVGKKNEHGKNKRLKGGWGLCYKYKILFLLMFFPSSFNHMLGYTKAPLRCKGGKI